MHSRNCQILAVACHRRPSYRDHHSPQASKQATPHGTFPTHTAYARIRNQEGTNLNLAPTESRPGGAGAYHIKSTPVAYRTITKNAQRIAAVIFASHLRPPQPATSRRRELGPASWTRPVPGCVGVVSLCKQFCIVSFACSPPSTNPNYPI